MNPLAIADSGTWSLGVLIGLPLLALYVVSTAVVTRIMFRAAKRDYYANGELRWIALGFIAVLVVVLVIVASPLGYWPYKAEYHQWRDVTGTVAQVDERIISNGSDGPSTKFVVQFSEDGQQFACDDTRCAQLDEGDSVALSCKRAWQYTGTDGYDCRFVSSEATR